MFKLETLESKVMAEWATVWSKIVHFFLILSSVHMFMEHTPYTGLGTGAQGQT